MGQTNQQVGCDNPNFVAAAGTNSLHTLEEDFGVLVLAC